MLENFYSNFKNYWKDIDKTIFLSFLLLFVLGIFFSFASTSLLAGEKLNKDYYFFFSKHLIFAIFSISLMIFISFIQHNFLKKMFTPFFFIALVALLLVLFFGVEVKGSKRWLDLNFFRFQPIEFLKPFFIVIIAKILSRENFTTSNTSYFLSFLCLIAPCIILLNQPDVGQTILLVLSWSAIVFISGIKLIYIFSLFGISFSFLASSLFLFPDKFAYVFRRIEVFFDPSKGDRVQSSKALEAIKEGGLTGQGMGEGTLKFRVPEAHTDYIISVIAEEFGSIISVFLIFIFLYIAFRVIKFVLQEDDKFTKIALSGLISLLVFQTFIHIGVNTSLLPTTGMTLPFLSYGGSSMLGSAMLAGIILNLTRKKIKNANF
ncbi:FtsW/RodA/SpoVE family cell cycle protein [Pelagibacteraceae bacterium]|nr:FtsW/RodA/SpoVE family cell cycle protein [Pelagibacteraceae bacterium]